MAHGRLPGESTYFNSLFMRTLTEFPLLTPPPLRLINFKSSKANENMGVGGGGGGGGKKIKKKNGKKGPKKRANFGTSSHFK